METIEFEKIEVNTPKIPEIVLNKLVEAMEAGKIHIGEELPSERDLATSMGVSRGSVRESLAVLAFMGIIENQGNRKIVVKDADYFRKALAFINLSLNSDTFWDFMDFRRYNECRIAELAAINATPSDIQNLKRTVDQLAEDPGDFRADVDFHGYLANASHNTIYATIMDFVNTMIVDLRFRYSQRPDYHQKTVKAHKAICDAVAVHDPEKAAEAMGHHLDLIEEYYEEETGKQSPYRPYPRRRKTL